MEPQRLRQVLIFLLILVLICLAIHFNLEEFLNLTHGLILVLLKRLLMIYICIKEPFLLAKFQLFTEGIVLNGIITQMIVFKILLFNLLTQTGKYVQFIQVRALISFQILVWLELLSQDLLFHPTVWLNYVPEILIHLPLMTQLIFLLSLVL